MSVLIALGAAHLLNDLIQSLVPAAYPVLRDAYHLDYGQIGIITLTFQIAGSLFQPLVGHYTDSRPLPYSTAAGMVFSLLGLLGVGFSTTYALILVSVTSIGIGSAIFHPDATRLARFASGGRQGLAQGIFQVGGQTGSAFGPLLAALIIVQRGQGSVAWFAVAALAAMVLLVWVGRRHSEIRARMGAMRARSLEDAPVFSKHTVTVGLVILALLLLSKMSYVESFRSFYTFYLIERFGISIANSQLMLFVFLASSAAGALLGGMVSDRVGRYRIIWISVLGPLPLTLLLPYADLMWTGILTVMINLIMASAFASIMIYAMELMPNRIGLVGGLFYGLNFGIAGIAAALLGALADTWGLDTVYRICSFFPLAGLLTWWLPRIDEQPAKKPAPTR